MKINDNNSIDIITTIQSTKMTDQYKFSQFQTNLYIINKENDEIVCIINEVNNLLTVLSLVKCLISTININDTMYRVKELERMYVDKSKSVFCKIEV